MTAAANAAARAAPPPRAWPGAAAALTVRALLLAAVLGGAAAGAGGCAAPAFLKETPRHLAFHPVREAVPGATVVSENVRLEGLLGRRPIVAYAGGDAAGLVVNGRPVGVRRAFVREGDKVALAVVAPEAPGRTAAATLEVGNGRAEFRVASARRPSRRLEFGETVTAPGRRAVSPVVAPAGFAPGSRLTVEGGGTVQVETREGLLDLPAVIDPGEPFRLVTRLPAGAPGPLRLRVRLGGLKAAWIVRPERAEERRAEATAAAAIPRAE